MNNLQNKSDCTPEHSQYMQKHILPHSPGQKALQIHHPEIRFQATDYEKAAGSDVHWFFYEENKWETFPSSVTVLNNASWGPHHSVPQI
jgi:hypothetical protein